MKKALICGVSGQDGSYLAKLLLSKNYKVWGSSRNTEKQSFSNLVKLKIKHKINLVSLNNEDLKSCIDLISTINPDEIYFLSGQSSVSFSFQYPIETIKSFVNGIINILQAVKIIKSQCKIYNASSSECFGDIKSKFGATENTPFQPKSPYGIAKSSAHWIVKNYRQSFNMFACNGILFNHESPLRSQTYVTKKIISSAVRIYYGSNEKLTLGRLDIKRDWGWAPDYVVGMWKMLQQKHPEDFVLSTGVSHTLEKFVDLVFSELNLNWKNYVEVDKKYLRPSDILNSFGDSKKANKKLNWIPLMSFSDLISKLIDEEMKLINPKLCHE